MEENEYFTTLDEVTKITYDTDIYEQVRLMTTKENHEINNIFEIIVNNINIHYSHYLKEYPNPSPERTKYLIDHIEGELSFYVIEAEQASKNK